MWDNFTCKKLGCDPGYTDYGDRCEKPCSAEDCPGPEYTLDTGNVEWSLTHPMPSRYNGDRQAYCCLTQQRCSAIQCDANNNFVWNPSSSEKYYDEDQNPLQVCCKYQVGGTSSASSAVIEAVVELASGDAVDAVVAEAAGGCHPAETNLLLENGDRVCIEEVRVGTRIQTPEGVEPIVLMMHANNEKHEYVLLQSPHAKLYISELHHLFVQRQNKTLHIEAGKVNIGDAFLLKNGESSVITGKHTEYRSGQYHITVPSGAYYAEGVEVSDFVSCDVDFTDWSRIRAYCAWRERIGFPMVLYSLDGDGERLFDHDWMAKVVEWLLGIDLWEKKRSKWCHRLAVVSALSSEACDMVFQKLFCTFLYKKQM